MSDPVFSERPVFIGWIAFLIQLPLQLFFTVWSGGFFGGLDGPVCPGLAMAVHHFRRLGLLRGTRRCLLRQEVELQPHGISVFPRPSRIRRRLLLDQQEDRHVSRRARSHVAQGNVPAPLRGLGTIYLATLATGTTGNFNPFVALGFGNVSASGVSVRDVNHPDQVFEKVRQLIGSHRP